MECCRTREYIRSFRQTYRERFENIPQDHSLEILRICLVGDPFSILDSFFNMDVEKKLAALGVEVNRWFWLGSSVDLFPVKNWLGLGRQKRVERAAGRYLHGGIGGLAHSTVGETVLLSQDEYDGLIHMAPFNCTPEVIAENVLLPYEDESPGPILYLDFDEHTSSGGLSKRLEAFTDMLRRKGRRSRDAT